MTAAQSETEQQRRLAPYVPRLVAAWHTDEPERTHRTVDGTLISADISGFTALSERLAQFGNEGAEELTLLLNECFGAMIDVADGQGGDILKFGGDALLILFTGPDHPLRAAAAAIGMRAQVGRSWSTRHVPRVSLGISQGVHTGSFNLYLVQAGHRELLLTGPDVSTTVRLEDEATAGQILLSPEMAACLPRDALGPKTGSGHVLDAVSVAMPEGWTPSSESRTAHEHLGELLPSVLVAQIEAGGAAEHRQATTVFLAFSATDAMTREAGPQAVDDQLERLAGAVRDAMDSFGVTWLASDVYPNGGKIILTAGAPVSAGQDEDRALLAVRSILDAGCGLPLRAGVNRGHVFVGDLGSPLRRTFTVMGDAVNVAARLMQAAQANQMIASTDVTTRVRTRFQLDPLPPLTVKGKSEPLQAALVGASLGGSKADATEALPFVGRDAELKNLEKLLHDVRQGRGRTVEIVGDAGMGKTRLLRELASRNPDIATFETAGGQYARTTPYFAVRRFLRSVASFDDDLPAAAAGDALTAWVERRAPDLVQWLPLIAIAFDAEVPSTAEVDRLDESFRRQRMQSLLADLLDAVLDEPAILIVEDAHLLDQVSQEIFSTIAGRVEENPWLLATTRAPDSGRITAAPGRSYSTVALGPASAEAARQLVRLAARDAGVQVTAADVDRLTQRGAGNPLFIIEMISSLRSDAEGDLPESVEALVTTRIDTLQPADRSLLRRAAVQGTVIDLDVAAEVEDRSELADPSAWGGLEEFLEPGQPGRLQYRHAIYRDVAYGGLSYSRRRETHLNVGLALENRSDDDVPERSSLLSLHFSEGGAPDKAWNYSVQAGDRARAGYANVEAARFYRRALAAAGPNFRVADDDISRVAEALGDVAELAAMYDRADEAYRRARKANTGAAAAVRLMKKQGVIRERQGRYTDALRWYGRGLKRTDEIDDLDERHRIHGELCAAYAGVRYRQGRYADCITWAHRAADDAESVGDKRALAHAYYLLDLGYSYLGRPEGAAYRDKTLPLFEEVEDRLGTANVLNNIGIAAYYAGRWADALDLYERSRAAQQDAGNVIGEATSANNIGEILSDQGRTDEAVEMFEEVLTVWRRARYPVGVAVATSNLGLATARRGDAEAGLELLDEALHMFTELNAAGLAADTKIRRIEALIRGGRADDAIDESERLMTELQAGQHQEGLAAALLRLRGAAFEAAGDDGRAFVLYEQSIELARSVDATYDLALALLGASRTAAALGDASAADLAAEATALLTELSVAVTAGPLQSGPGSPG